ncbi:MAG: protein translocase subunit SecF [Minisyncoccia bacterium]
MQIVKYRKIFYFLSIALFTIAIASLFIWGLNLGIDFKGGTSIEVEYANARPDTLALSTKLDALTLDPSIKGLYTITPYGTNGYQIKMRNVTEIEKKDVISSLSEASSTAELKSFNSIGPVLGQEAQKKALVSIILVILFIVLFITFAFRKVSEPVSSWKYGLITIVALLHDVILPIGIFSILGHFAGYEVDTLFVTAVLVILGFSVHDTIVVFDRVRENLKINRENRNAKTFETVVGESVNQTIVRSINTSLTTMLAVLAVYFLGPDTTRHFALALVIGVFFGTYSSIFIASNLLVTVQKFQDKRNLLKK